MQASAIAMLYRIISPAPQNSMPYPLKLSPFSKSLTATDFLFYRFTFSKISYNRNHTVCSIFRLASFTSDMYIKADPCLFGLTCIFLLYINNIPLNRCTTICLFIHLLKIRGLFSVLGNRNKAAINIHM